MIHHTLLTVSNLKISFKTPTKCSKGLFITSTNNPELGSSPITNLIIKRLKITIKKVVFHYKSNNRSKDIIKNKNKSYFKS